MAIAKVVYKVPFDPDCGGGFVANVITIHVFLWRTIDY